MYTYELQEPSVFELIFKIPRCNCILGDNSTLKKCHRFILLKLKTIGKSYTGPMCCQRNEQIDLYFLNLHKLREMRSKLSEQYLYGIIGKSLST